MEAFLTFSIAVHVGAALLALVVMPLLFLGPKGTPLHIRCGKAVVVIAIVLLVAAAAIVLNPEYVERLNRDAVRYGWSGHVSRALFLWIWGYFFYLFFSGLRVWFRWGRSKDFGAIDVGLTGVGLLLGGAGTVISVTRVVDGPLDWPRLLPMSATMLVFAALDIRSFRRPFRTFREAYFAHGSRMYFSWWMLLMGPLLRNAEWGATESIVSSLGVVAAYVLLRQLWSRQFPERASVA